MKRKIWLWLLTLILVSVSCQTDTQQKSKTSFDQKTEILVLHAGSLSIPFKEIARRFKIKFPGVDVKLEAHGSRTCARQISDLRRPADVMASADSEVILNLLIPEFADYCIHFTTNEMAIMYIGESKFSDIINDRNWMEILLRSGVEYGHSDPNSDPCGYRALLTWQLAEKHYRIPGLFRKLKEKMPQRNIRPKETDLIAMLEAGELDYIFIYRSVAQQHQVKYIVLPDAINLKSPELKEFYGNASIMISGKEPGQNIEKRGAPMVYGITVPKIARNPEWGIRFIAFVLGQEGREIMKQNGQPEIIPPRVDHYNHLPETLKRFFKK